MKKRRSNVSFDSFIPQNYNFIDVLKLSLDDKTVIIDKLELRAMCEEDSSLEESVTESIHRLYGAVMPIPTQKII